MGGAHLCSVREIELWFCGVCRRTTIDQCSLHREALALQGKRKSAPASRVIIIARSRLKATLY